MEGAAANSQDDDEHYGCESAGRGEDGHQLYDRQGEVRGRLEDLFGDATPDTDDRAVELRGLTAP